MHDIKFIRNYPEEFEKLMRRRGLDIKSSFILEIDTSIRGYQTEIQTIQQKRNTASKEIGKLLSIGSDVSSLKLNLDQTTHKAVFVRIHKEGDFLQNPKAIENFLKKFGIAPEITKQYLNSFSVRQKVNRGIKVAKQLKISAVPMMIVDGTYIIESKRSFEEMLNVVEHVIEIQKSNS